MSLEIVQSFLQYVSFFRRFFVTFILVIFSLLFLFFFSESKNISSVLQQFIVSIFFFLIIPLVYSRIVMKEPWKNIGFQKGYFWTGLFLGIFSVLFTFSVFWWTTIFFPSFKESYVLPGIIQASFWWFVFYELIVVPLLLILYEVFFRGLIQFFWLKDFGMWAIVIQTFFFGLFSINNISWQQFPLLLFCPFAGLIAFFSKSLWYSFVASWTFLFLVDIFFLISH